MPLSKYPIEIPLGGAVDEGNVPEIVQPPRIREATNCVSIKGGAYSKSLPSMISYDWDGPAAAAAEAIASLSDQSSSMTRSEP